MQQWLHNAYWFLQLLFVLFLSSNIIYHYTSTANQLLEMKVFEQKKNKLYFLQPWKGVSSLGFAPNWIVGIW